MIYFFKKLKSYKLKATSYKLNAGMSYVELIVVLSIFAVLSSVAVYNYGSFQNMVDIKNLGSDIASKIVEAQKSSLNGVLPVSGSQIPDWKPSYGIYFNINTNPGGPEPLGDNKSFIYFVDLNNDGIYGNGEALDTISITKGNYINTLEECPSNGSCHGLSSSLLSITFKRPDSSAIFYSNGILSVSGYIRITIKSANGTTAFIKIYPSGRVQIN